METVECDVLIVGSGGAAVRAAIAAKGNRPEQEILLVTKGTFGCSGVTAKACSDRMAFHATLPYTEPGGEDNWRYHAGDIYGIGGGVSDENLAEILARDSGAALEYLLGLDVPFVRKEDGKVDQFVTDGSEYPRAAYTGPYTAVDIEKGLVREFFRHKISLRENCEVFHLLKDPSETRIAGAMALRENSTDNEILLIKAGSVILATGGGGQIFELNVFPPENTGESFGMALEAGAELVNMEFVQLGVASVDTRFNCSGSMFRAMPRIVDENGREFLPDYIEDPRGGRIMDITFRKGASWPVSYEHDTRIIDIAVSREISNGHRIFLDYSQNPDRFDWSLMTEENLARYMSEAPGMTDTKTRYSSPLSRLMEINMKTVDWFAEHGIDIAKGEKIEIGICGQHFQGGIKIGPKGNTKIPGLFAAGECAGGQHGANRPGGNALLDCQVFGRIAGCAASDFALSQEGTRDISEKDIEKALSLLERLAPGHSRKASEIRDEIKSAVSGCCSVFRTTGGYEDGLGRIRALRSEAVSSGPEGMSFALETYWMLRLAEAMILAGMTRKESRGPHLFFDSAGSIFPMPRDDEHWCRYIVLMEKEGKILTEIREPVVTGNSKSIERKLP